MRVHRLLAVVAVLLAPAYARAATTELISVAMGGGPADDVTISATMTPNGRWVAFASAATNLVAGDANVFCDIDADPDDESCPDIFIRDRETQATTIVSVDSLGVQGNQESRDPDISADGRWVVFESLASNLVAGDTNDESDCFLHDRETGATERVSITSSEAEASGTQCRVSDDGRFVVFTSDSYALVPFADYRDIFIRDRQLGTTQRISHPGLFGDNECDDGDNANPSISDDGNFVLFTHFEDINACDTEDFVRYMFLFDRVNTTWQRIAPSQLYNAGPLDFARFFTYRAWGSVSAASLRVFVRDRELGKTEEIGVATDGTRANDNSFGGRITRDGRYVAFSSRGDNLVPDDTNVCQFGSCADVFVRDREAKTTERVSLTAAGGQSDEASTSLAIADGGTAVLFVSLATNLVPGDTNGVQDAFVRASVCGDGTLDRGEECDDGGTVGGDGCSADCLLDCPATPRSGCLLPSLSGKATIKLDDRTPSTKDQLQWKWSPGPATPKSAFGQPGVADGYTLCVYDASGLVLTAGMPPGVQWKEKPTGFTLKRKSGAPDGIVGVTLKAGIAGKSKIQIKGKGSFLPTPALATLAPPLTVQLANTLGVSCWEAIFGAPWQRQDAAQLKDRAD